MERIRLAEPFIERGYPEQLAGDLDRLITLESEAARLDSVALSPAQLADLALILNGGYRPLRGYMNQTDYESVLETLRLADGAPFPVPVVLDVDMTTAHALETGKRIVLRDGEGTAFALLTVDDIWRKDARREAELLGVADYAHGGGSCYLGGRVDGIRFPAHPFFPHLRPAPSTLVKHIRKRGFNRVLAVECKSLIKRRHHEIITRAAAELDAAILLHPAIGAPDPGNPLQVATIKSLLAALPYFPRRTTLLALLDYPVRGAGAREFLMHALLRKRFGATHFMMRGATQRALDGEARLQACAVDIGVTVVAWPERSFAHSGGPVAESARDNGAVTFSDRLALKEKFQIGGGVSEEDTFPEVAAVLEAHSRSSKRGGFTLFFTGPSGSGKSTIAKILHAWIAQRDPRSVTQLKDDTVRRRLSKGLGLTEQDRDASVRRIGAAAADVTKRGGIAICCTFPPYAETRKAVRAMVEPHGSMIDIHMATAPEICQRRNPKELCEKARKGRFQDSTAVDGAYEAPRYPDLRLDASQGTPEAAAERVLAHLEDIGLIARRDA